MRVCLFALLLVVASALCLHAQTTEADLDARMRNKPLYLRGAFREDKLHFDPKGQLLGSGKVASFTLAGFELDKLKLEHDRLFLQGRRIFLVFNKDVPTRVPMNLGNEKHPKYENVDIEIQAPRDGDYAVPISAIFADGLAEMVPSLPPAWHSYGVKHFLAPGSPDPSPSPAPTAGPIRRVGGDITPPRVVFAPEPEFSEEARRMKMSGNILVYLQVNEQGLPENLAILRPRGAGLDERALAAVARYRFNPSMRNGQPVRIEMNVEVNFQLF